MVYRHLTENDKREICAWRYPGEYEKYNLPAYEEMEKEKAGFMDTGRERNYYGFFADEALVGFINIREEPQEVFIGIGVHPQYCGKGHGQKMLMEAYGISKRLYPKKPMYLQVRTWNTRAVKCYQNAGFQIDGKPLIRTTPIGKGKFYRMIKE